MENWISEKNGQSLSLREVPVLRFAELREDIVEKCRHGMRIAGFFGHREEKTLRLFIVLASDAESTLLVSSAVFSEDEKSYESLTPELPQFSMFEREFYESYGIEPLGHPWLKSVRFPHDGAIKKNEADYPFFKVGGEGIHEVGVGPVHAGVIEPGHFRFMCDGEKVIHLEIHLGYQHRGIEKLMTFPGAISGKSVLAESIAGDSVIANMMAFCAIAESGSEGTPPLRAVVIRTIAMEMERAAIHIGNLAALAGDIGYLTANAFFGATRTYVINLLLAFSGSRFGRGLIRPGGIVYDIDPEIRKAVISSLKMVKDRVILMGEQMFDFPGVLSRFQRTGVVDAATAHKIGMVGLAARASGLKTDVRSDHPSGLYRFSPLHRLSMETGDVFARAFLRYLEIKQSLDFVLEQLEELSDEGSIMKSPAPLKADSFIMSLVEGVRGEIAHFCITDSDGNISRYKIKDPSFNNWPGLAYAVRNEGISDFPLCNKSFDLSYCGFDL
ncbi:MAG: hypothetical protein A2020_15445 [Lentisphaerae bacterium GWF2_45_14]|nr:MAG: hypothetical protein A2020_15445 [Lentisphaerae bacterium GWF2_45_14]